MTSREITSDPSTAVLYQSTLFYCLHGENLSAIGGVINLFRN